MAVSELHSEAQHGARLIPPAGPG